MIDTTTPNIALPLPHPENTLEVDVMRLRSALDAVDLAVKQLADSSAAHGVDLQALSQAQTDMSQAHALEMAALRQSVADDIAALQGSIEAKSVDLQAVAGASSAAQARAGGVALQRLRYVLATSATNGMVLEAGVVYAVQADAAFSRPLPAEPQGGDTVELLDPWGLWATGRFTLTRSNAEHQINERAENVVFNTNARRVKVTYAAENHWVLSIG